MSLPQIVCGGSLRKSRLHDEKGNFVGWRRLALHGPRAALSGILRLATGYRPATPWISYSAIRVLARSLTKRSRVLEFGSGMSTIWFAAHAGNVWSVEDYRPWYDKVRRIMVRREISNVHYEFARDDAEYAGFMSADPDGFDVIMVDGSSRSLCVVQATKLVRPSGIIYLDNSDKDSSGTGGDMRVAERDLREFAVRAGATVREITDFAPTQLFVQQGLLLRMPG